MNVLKSRFTFAILLLSVAAIWGSAFVVMKGAIKLQNVNDFLACRFIIAALLMLIFRPSILKKIDRRFALQGIIIGTLLGSGYIFQTFGLSISTVAKTGFITGLYVVLTPVIAGFILKKRITRIDWISVGIASIGLLLLSFKGFSAGMGEFLVFISAVLFALHIVALGEWSPGRDIYTLTFLQLATCAVITTVCALKDGFQLPPDASGWRTVLYTAIFATFFAFIMQTWAQSFMPATTVAVLLTTEIVFAALFAIMFAGEKLTVRTSVGGVLVMMAMYAIIIGDSREKVPR